MDCAVLTVCVCVCMRVGKCVYDSLSFLHLILIKNKSNSCVSCSAVNCIYTHRRPNLMWFDGFLLTWI